MATKTPDRSGYFSIPVSPDFLLEISKGSMPGYEAVVLEGYMDGADAALRNLGFYWDGVESTETAYTFLSTGTELFVSSSDVGDTQNITVEGVDGSYNKKTATVALSGQSQVSLGTDWLRVNFARNTGSTDFAGKIYIAETDTLTAGVPDTDSKVKGFIHIDPDTTRSQNIMKQFPYTVPAGHTIFLLAIRVSIGDILGAADTVLCTREISINGGPRQMVSRPTYQRGVSQVPLNNFTKFDEKTDIIIEVLDGAAGDVCVNIEFDAILVENDQF